MYWARVTTRALGTTTAANDTSTRADERERERERERSPQEGATVPNDNSSTSTTNHPGITGRTTPSIAAAVVAAAVG